MKTYLRFVILLVFLLAACQTSPLTVGNTYMTAVEKGDEDAMLAAASDSVTLIIDGGPAFHNEMTGKEALRAYTQSQKALASRLERTGDPVVNGNEITYPTRFTSDELKGMGIDWLTGKEVVTVEKDKVVRDAWIMDENSLQKMLAAVAALQGLTPKKLAGTWGADVGEGIGVVDFRYHEDGTFEMIRYISGSDEMLWDAGSYTIDGDTVTLTTGKDHYCGVGDRGVYKMRITEDERLETILVEDNCWKRKPPTEEPMYLSRYNP
jgi:hypothetical protein